MYMGVKLLPSAVSSTYTNQGLEAIRLLYYRLNRSNQEVTND
jgi:hypothetical protein